MCIILYLGTHPLFTVACYASAVFAAGQTTWGVRKCVDFLIALWEAAGSEQLFSQTKPGLITDQMRRMTMKQFYVFASGEKISWRKWKINSTSTVYRHIIYIYNANIDSRDTALILHPCRNILEYLYGFVSISVMQSNLALASEIGTQ